MGGTFKLPFGELTVTFNEADLIWADYRMKDFIPAADVEVRGLRNRYRTPGIGAPLAASIEPIGAREQTGRLYSIPAEDSCDSLSTPRRSARGTQVREAKGRAGILYPGFGKIDQSQRRRGPYRIRNDFCPCPALEGSPVWDFEIAGFRSGDFTIGKQKVRRNLYAAPAS